VARNDLLRHYFKTPKGRSAHMWWREGTSDWNTLYSAMNEDEYRLRDMSLSGVALDIGGHIGSVTVDLLVDFPDLRVITVEPIPENIDLLHKNVAAQGLSPQWRLYEGAAGYAGGSTTIRFDYKGSEVSEHHAWIGNTTLFRPEEEHQALVVPTFAISDLVPEGDIDFCKIDCEGGEWDFLDSPDVARIAYIVGERHQVPRVDDKPSDRAELLRLLGPTHDVTFNGPEEGPEGFHAVRNHMRGAS
jgi:FkbM family methyltransferase